MDKKIFKGFRQVTAAKFQEALDANNAAGYLWFVRTEVPETEGANDVSNDEYDIYFGAKKYGHFCEGEIPGIKAAIESLGGDVTEITKTLETLTEVLEGHSDAIEENKKAHEANASAISGLQTSLAEYFVKNIDSNDKVLNIADGIISSQIGIKYQDGFVKLTGKDGEVIEEFDASDFIKDSVLEDVDVVTKEDNEKYIVFTWKVEGEEAKTDEIKVSDFAKLYSAGKALELAEDGVTFNVKIASNDNFLTVNEHNELIVDDVTTNKTLTSEAITIEGGPLASDAVKAAFPNGVIPAGADIQSVLKALLCVEIYPIPTANTSSITYSVSISAPSVTSNDVTNNNLVEVGKKISFNSVTAKQVSITKTEPKVSTFEHGYSDSIDGDIINEQSISGEWTINQKNENVYQLSAAKSGFTGDLPTTVQNAVYSSCVLAACELVASLGTNEYSVTEDAPAHVGSYTGVESKYIVSNLGGRSEDKKSPAIEAKSNIEKDPSNQTGKLTVTGVYPCYTNMVSSTAANTVTVEKGLTLTSGKTFEISFGPETNAFHAFAFPATHTLSSVEIYNTMSKAYETYSGGSSTEDAKYTVQGNELDYKVWKRAGNAYTEGTKFKFTLNKNLNTK